MQRLNLSICPRGIETFDAITGETLHRISIYKISYCSADAAHRNVFAFIASSSDITDDDKYKNVDDDLMCYAFLCAKRRIAHNLTITVAKNFERAFERWKQTKHPDTENVNNTNAIIHSIPRTERWKENQANDAFYNLIDFEPNPMENSPIECQKRLLQTTWISFEDDFGIENGS